MLEVKQIKDVPENKVEFLKAVAIGEGALKADSFPQPDGKFTLIIVFEKKPGAVGQQVASAAADHGATMVT